jgi:autotransporter-associated beta strand protein
MAQINRANAAVNLNLSGAWVGGVAPTSIDIATWGTPNTTVGNTQPLGGVVSWQGIRLQSEQTTNIIIGATSAAITIGASGIDLSASGANLNINSPVAVVLGASQTWTVASGRTLTSSAVANAISGNAQNLILDGLGTKTLPGAATNWTNSTVTVAAGLAIANANNSLGAASNVVVVQSGAALRVSAAAPAQTSWSISGSGLSGSSYGALWTDSVFGNSTRIITTKAQNTVLSIRAGVTFTGTVVLDTGINTITLNGEAASAADLSVFGMTTTSSYVGTVTLSSLGLDGTSFRAVKYTIGAAAGATDANNSGGGGLGNNANNIVVSTTGGINSQSASGAFNRNYTFNARGARQLYNQFRLANSNGTATFNGTLTLSGGASDYVQFAGNNDDRSIVKLNGTVTGGANIDVGSNGSNGNVDGTLELGSALNSSGWPATAALSVNHLRYGSSLANDNPITFQEIPTILLDAVASGITARHISYTNVSASVLSFAGTNSLTMTGPVAGSANWTGALGTVTVTANTLTLGFNVVSSAVVTKTGAGTLVLEGNNTGITAATLSAGALVLNNAGSVGGAGATFLFATNTELDSTTGAVLHQTGAINTGAGTGSWTWKGTSSLTFGAGNVTTGGDRTITFAGGGQIGTLKFSGAITTPNLTTSWNFGGATPGAKQRVTLVGANASLAETTAANQHAVTAGYFRIEDNNGLGAVSATTTWWVGATNLGVQTTKAALELAGVTTPEIKSVNLYNIGPNNDGALIGASGTSVFSGNISVLNVAGTRIGVKTGATLTLLGSGIYPNLNPANAGTPLSFTAESGGTLNVNRVLGGGGTSNAGTVTVENGTGTVVFSRANLHTGAMTCSAGTTKLTDVNAAGTTAGNDVTVTTGATMEVTVKAVFPATLTLGNSPTTPAIFKVSV